MGTIISVKEKAIPVDMVNNTRNETHTIQPQYSPIVPMMVDRLNSRFVNTPIGRLVDQSD